MAAVSDNIKNLFSKISRKRKQLGTSGLLKFIAGKLTGNSKRQEEIDTLYYLLNHYIDITKYPPATGALRKLQLCDAVMLKSFANICEREGWTYWLDYGTLLGAARHKGFIPWDDDQDVSMPREDYDKAMKKLPEIFASYGDDSLSLYAAGMDRFGIGYRHSQTGVWCDIFPVDDINVDTDDMKILHKRVRRLRASTIHTRVN